MTKVIVFGRVHPAGFKVNANAANTKYDSHDGLLRASFDVEILDSEITVTWRVENFDRAQLASIWHHSKRFSTAIVDLIAFRMGVAVTAIVDRLIVGNGAMEDLSFVEPAVKDISTSLRSDADMNQAVAVIAEEQNLMIALDDLITSLWSHDHKLINCITVTVY